MAATGAASVVVETQQGSVYRPFDGGRWPFVCWLVIFWRLGYLSLLDPDEAHYAELTREMRQAGSWLVPLLDGVPFIDKPVFFHWLQAVPIALLGETETAMRLPSAFAAIGLVLVTRWLGKELFGGPIGAWGALMLATVPLAFALSRVAVLDMVFALFLFGGVACLIVAALRGRRHSSYAGYVLLTLAVMTKGPVALVLVAALFSAAWICDPRWRLALRTVRWKMGLLGVALASSPWFLWMWWRFGGQFIEGYLLAGNLWYFTQPENFSRREVDHVFYLRTIAGGFFPWSIVLFGHAVDTIRRGVRRLAPCPEQSILWIWTIVVVGFFSVARFKLDPYVFPVAPACCLLAARAWYGASNPGHRTDHPGAAWSIILLSILLVLIGVGGGIYLARVDLDLSPFVAIVPLAFAAGGVMLGMATLAHRRAPASPMVPIGMLLVVYFMVVAVGFPLVERTRPVADIARALEPRVLPDDRVGLYRLERWRASLRYYVRHPVARLEQPEEIAQLATGPGHTFVVMLQQEYDALLAAGSRLRVVEARPIVVRSAGWAVRTQQWSNVVVVTPSE